jgi:predicted TIM-barrel fold metal-dependent hydrolase
MAAKPGDFAAIQERRLTKTHTKRAATAAKRDPHPPRPTFPFVSVDDHVLEPPDTFKGRLPQRFAEQTPKVERTDGVDYWVFPDERTPVMASDGVASWEPTDWDVGMASYEDFRPGVYDVQHRIRDMDMVGMWASLNFPSIGTGFCGQRFLRTKDRDLGLSLLRAYNDWMREEWIGPYKDRLIACQVPWLADPEVAAQEIRRNAGRGFQAVAFSENPEKLGLPSIHSGQWDPFLAACAETGTVVNLHIGSSSQTFVPSSDSPNPVMAMLCVMNAWSACVDWLYSPVPQRFPEIKIVLSEGGIGWVPIVLDRIQFQIERFMVAAGNRDSVDVNPAEIQAVLRRNFSFATYFDPSAMKDREYIGIDRILIEADYPHADSTWPDSQRVNAEVVEGLSDDERRAVLYANACSLYSHPTPPDDFLANLT